MDEATRKYIDDLIAQAKLTDPQEASILEARKAQIEAMSPEDQMAAVADLTAAYEPMRDDLRDELAQNYDMLTAEGPQGQMAGNNQFSVYVAANPLEHLASGFGKYQAGKGMKENREELKKLSERQGKAQGDVMMAGLNPSAVSSALRAKKSPYKQPWETDEEYLRRTGGRVSI